ncbi:MAG: TIGR02147 family protein [Bdellovibrionia bacterium]
MLEIYQYGRASQFIRDAWAEKKKNNKSFSLRAWARQLGFANNAPLSLMLAGKRPIPKKYVPALVGSLELSPDEGLFLETLVEMERAKTVRQKSFYVERLRALSPRPPIGFHEVESFKCLGNPLHTFILEMTDLQGFKPDPEWIQRRLRTRFSIVDIKAAVERLIALGLLIRDNKGLWRKTNAHLTNRADIADEGSQEYHKNVSQMAAEQVSLQHVLDREFNGYAINIKNSDIPRAKKLIREFVRDFARKIESEPGMAEETYQLNVQFFGITKNIKGEKK